MVQRRRCAIIFLLCLAFQTEVFPSQTKQIESIAAKLSKQLLDHLSAEAGSVACLPFENNAGEATFFGQILSEEISRQILHSGKLTLVERKELNKIFQEWKLHLSGAINSKTTQKVGELAGANYLLIGSVENVGEAEVLIFAKLIHGVSGEIRGAASASARLEEELLRLHRPITPSEKSEEEAFLLDRRDSKGGVWVESEGIVRFGEEETKKRARARAVARARQKAMAKALGKDVSPAFSNFGGTGSKNENDFLDMALSLTRYGRVREEKIVEEGVANVKDCKGCIYRVVMQICIQPPRVPVDPGFQISLSLNRSEFFEGEEAVVLMNTTRDAYVFLVSVDQKWEKWIAFPNPKVPQNFVKADSLFTYPDPVHKGLGIRLVAELPKGVDSSLETFRALATKKPVPNEVLEERYDRLLSRLDELGIDWSESAVAFTIQKK